MTSIAGGARRPLHVSEQLASICAMIGATHFIMIAGARDHRARDARVIASNWPYDAVIAAGPEALADITRLAGHGTTATARVPDGHRAALGPLERGGTVHVLRVHAGTRSCHLILSAAEFGAMDVTRLERARLLASYLVSQASPDLPGGSSADSLSDRERECLYWVSEGKTTGEVATIIGVTANTVNSYVANAMQKFAASNRAMAIASAIRAGAI